ncbi:MAG: hypothetical protein LBQ61_09970, partial [Spirochaetales bacterium]|nr:hypothetical protein [Spirochaetales bacterium]
MKLLSCAESARIDREGLLRFALNQDALIEQAGLRLWEAFLRARRRTSPPGGGGRLVFLAGPGNNGRDAQVMARLARAAGGFQPAVIFSAPAARGAAEPWLRAWGVPGLLPEEEPEEVRALLGGADYIIDGLCGTGLTGPLRAPEARLVAQANASPAVRLALDLPSGARDDFCPGDPVFQGRWTLTIALPKTCLYLPALRPAAGRIILVPLAFPPALLEDPGLPGRRLDWSEARTLIPGIPPEAHKYRRGHCAVFAGLPRQGGALGAGILAARGAAAGPAGLVSLYLPDDQPGGGFEAAAAGISAGAPELLVKPESAGFPLPPTVKSLVAGPGWGGAGEGRAAQLRALFDSGLPGVLDADGLRVFAGAPELHPPRDRWVFTPHSG